MERIIVGRNVADLASFGDKGTGFLGKHVVGSGEQMHLTNPIYMDLARPHIVLVCGKRGTGKSYDGGVVAEEVSLLSPEIRKNLSVLIFDTMGIYWSMKMANDRDQDLLNEWGLKPHAMKTKLVVPKAFVESYKEVGVAVDAPLVLPCGELSATDWIIAFGFSPIDEHGIGIERAIKAVSKRYGTVYSIDDITKAIGENKRLQQHVRESLLNRFEAAKEWGLFEKRGTPLQELFAPGVITIVDVSHYAGANAGWSVRGMLVGLLSRQIYQERLVSRKAEEFEVISGERRKTIPMVWIMIDEAHMFLPNDGETAASSALQTLVKQGREPGISLLFITQRPNKLHEDALAQADLVISHRLTAKADIEALRSVMQTYMLEDLQDALNGLPDIKGAALILDDNSERILSAVIRPRFSWHAGGSPMAVKKKSLFEE
ncbi:MAG: ATP-binding protein [Nanoarchaeota archaeon]|nr:ATP-binding protein [Nanoarchaeota archaeon]